jgi:hypothetical protein
MATVTNKRKVLRIEEKVKLIRKTENEKKKADVSVNSKIKKNWKNRIKIISAFQQNGSRIKRIRKPERSDADKALLKWFKATGNVLVSKLLIILFFINFNFRLMYIFSASLNGNLQLKKTNFYFRTLIPIQIWNRSQR